MMAPAPPRSSPRALRRSRPASLLAALLLRSDAAAAAVAVCTGKSASLPQSQCQAVVDLYDDTTGSGWMNPSAGADDDEGNPEGAKLTCQRNDPCGTCGGKYGIVCNTGGTTVTQMCVRLARAPPRVRAANCNLTDSASFHHPPALPPAAPQQSVERQGRAATRTATVTYGAGGRDGAQRVQ
jgi:hypothetical protein